MVYCLAICLTAFSIPHFAIFLNIVGAVAGIAVQFIFPIYMFFLVFYYHLGLPKKLELGSYLVIVTIVGCVSLIFSIV